jgi:microcystin-dependent protein
MFCEGQLLAISEQETLFNLIGTTYGGDGQSTFALPDLRSRAPVHTGSGFVLAETGGTETVTLTSNQIPAHQHPLLASNNLGNSLSPQNTVYAQVPPATVQVYTQDSAVIPIATPVVGVTGGSQPHENHQPLLAVSFILSLFGIFPSQT